MTHAASMRSGKGKAMTSNSGVHLITHDEALAELLKNPSFREHYEVRSAGVDLAFAFYRARKALGKSAEEVAALGGISPRQYKAIESGSMDVTFETLVRAARGMRLTLRIDMVRDAK